MIMAVVKITTKTIFNAKIKNINFVYNQKVPKDLRGRRNVRNKKVYKVSMKN